MKIQRDFTIQWIYGNMLVIKANPTFDPRWPADRAQVRGQLEFRFRGIQDSARFDLVIRQ